MSKETTESLLAEIKKNSARWDIESNLRHNQMAVQKLRAELQEFDGVSTPSSRIILDKSCVYAELDRLDAALRAANLIK